MKKLLLLIPFASFGQDSTFVNQGGLNAVLPNTDSLIYKTKMKDWYNKNTSYYTLDGKPTTNKNGLLIEQYPSEGIFKRKKILITE